MRILITGAAGFVGVNLTRHLLGKGHTVIGLDLADRHGRLSASRIMADKRYTFVAADLAKEVTDTSSLQDIDLIFHLAALPHVDYSYFYPRRVISNNVASLIAALELAGKMGRPLILASSVEIYGGSEDKIYTEADVPAPLSPYAASKVACEAMVRAYIETQGLHATIFRFTNLYGPWQAPDRLLPRVVAQTLTGQELTIEKGTNRDFVYVGDACQLLETAIGFDHTGEVFNLSSGIRIDNYEAVMMVQQVLPGGAIHAIPPRRHDGRGKFLIASPDKLVQKTGLTARTTLADGIADTVLWYKANAGWLAQFADNVQADRQSDRFLTDTNLHLAYW